MARSSPLRRNVELKARLKSLTTARRVARALATESLGVQRQTDTYFRVATGRLKLRVINGRAAQLVWYDRPDEQGSKTSRYRLVEIGDPAGLKASLTVANGVLVEVVKRREVFLVENVRIHLDRVDRLGTFLEFEAVLAPGQPVAQGRRQLARLSAEFGLTDDQRISGSYSDLLLEKSAT